MLILQAFGVVKCSCGLVLLTKRCTNLLVRHPAMLFINFVFVTVLERMISLFPFLSFLFLFFFFNNYSDFRIIIPILERRLFPIEIRGPLGPPTGYMPAFLLSLRIVPLHRNSVRETRAGKADQTLAVPKSFLAVRISPLIYINNW
jgi:hypothetical protein